MTSSSVRRLLRGKLGQFTAPFLGKIRDRLTGDEFVLARRYEWLLVDGPVAPGPRRVDLRRRARRHGTPRRLAV
ncbi:hypothetical protein GCM10017786_08420 [Amycolatopsis deserti]|uniref:Transposase n=1 Tax=Amycolatopsis deserti TaxID=185696 RepID=A0ABQ3IHT8_9PSEU|nr:hypothetical protein GCM10017786_08420 [Amycolatopsis deserti]